MAEIKEISKGGKKYFYLAQSYRQGKSVKKKYLYLGDTLPGRIKEKKEEFVREFYKEKFFGDIDKIQKNFSEEFLLMPVSARKKAMDNFSVKFTYNTQRIEGSTLSLKDTARLLEDGITPGSKPLRDVKEAEAHQNVFFNMLDYDGDLNFRIILKWHRELMRDTSEDIAGKIRNHDVAISGSMFKPPMHLELDVLLKEFFDWYSENKKVLHPVELAGLVHLKFVTIHPFSDGNGRISRLMMNFVLKRHKFPMMDIPYTKRDGYYNALERSNIKNDDGIFVQWLFRRYLAEYDRYLK